MIEADGLRVGFKGDVGMVRQEIARIIAAACEMEIVSTEEVRMIAGRIDEGGHRGMVYKVRPVDSEAIKTYNDFSKLMEETVQQILKEEEEKRKQELRKAMEDEWT